MTKGRVELPRRVVAGQRAFFITLGGPKAHWLLCRKTFPGKVRETADPSAALGMTKERAKAPWRAVAGQRAFFITLGGPQAHDHSGRDDTFINSVEIFNW
jgi:hypothetical protein